MDITPETPQLHKARAILARLSDQPGDDAYPATVALATLDLVHPPHPPVGELPSDVSVSLTEALDALAAAICVVEDPDTAARLAEASRTLQGQPVP